MTPKNRALCDTHYVSPNLLGRARTRGAGGRAAPPPALDASGGSGGQRAPRSRPCGAPVRPVSSGRRPAGVGGARRLRQCACRLRPPQGAAPRSGTGTAPGAGGAQTNSRGHRRAPVAAREVAADGRAGQGAARRSAASQLGGGRARQARQAWEGARAGGESESGAWGGAAVMRCRHGVRARYARPFSVLVSARGFGAGPCRGVMRRAGGSPRGRPARREGTCAPQKPEGAGRAVRVRGLVRATAGQDTSRAVSIKRRAAGRGPGGARASFA